jgi:hypothetical protein
MFFEMRDHASHPNKIITPSNRIFTEMLTVAQLVKKLPTFYGPAGTLPPSKGHSTDLYPDSDESSPHHI